MALNAFDTNELVRMIQDRRGPLPFYLSRYFPATMQFDSEEVHFDYVLGERKMAPFVSPLVEGKAMADLGSTMKSFRPAYVKPKHIVDPTKPLKRMPGEALMGSMSPMERMNAKIAENFMKEDDMITNRLEWMALEILRGGQLTVSGEDYPTKLVDYGRDTDLDDVTPAVLWNAGTTEKPLDDIEDVSTLMANADFGAPATDVIMAPDVWKVFRSHATVKDLLDTTYRGSMADINREPVTYDTNNAPMWMGRIGQFNFYVDARNYTNDAGSVVPYLASGDVIMVSPQIEGVQAYGAILDVDVLQPMARYPKTWTKEDPPVRYTMTQSAPLPIPQRINACAYIKAFG